MEREKINVRFAELRQLAIAIPTFMATKSGVDIADAKFAAAIEDDLGMTGLDAESLITEFADSYQVDLAVFDFTGFISDETVVGDFLVFPKLALLLLAWLGQAFVAGLCWPISRARAERMWQQPVLTFWLPKQFLNQKRPLANVLTVGDFVASAAAGHFVKRELVQFVLVKAAA